MSILLGLARDHLDRMANPAYGSAVNEEYSLRLAALLQREGVGNELEAEMHSLRDAGLLTSHGWMWFLGSARRSSSRCARSCCWMCSSAGRMCS